jgi:hypothetical protein
MTREWGIAWMTMVDRGSRGVIRVGIVEPSGRKTEVTGDVVRLKDGSYKIQPRDNVGSFVHVCDNPHVDVYLGDGLTKHDFDIDVRVALIASGPVSPTPISSVSGAISFAGRVAGVSGQPGTLNVEFTRSGIQAWSEAAVGGTLFVATPASTSYGG